MSNAQTEVDNASLEGVVAEWFFRRGMKISSVEIKPKGDAGDWEIGGATRRGGRDFDALARQAEAQLRAKYKLVRIEVHRVATPALQQ